MPRSPLPQGADHDDTAGELGSMHIDSILAERRLSVKQTIEECKGPRADGSAMRRDRLPV
ncbi:hypothetical protein HZA86_05460 [Candidatus Uhrbacteria bacterium]|nr:hypothetical protein [Candidatus Uhrbacteria bacterium]